MQYQQIARFNLPCMLTWPRATHFTLAQQHQQKLVKKQLQAVFFQMALPVPGGCTLPLPKLQQETAAIQLYFVLFGRGEHVEESCFHYASANQASTSCILAR